MVDLNELVERLRGAVRPCDIMEAADVIDALRTALSQEREAREKAEKDAHHWEANYRGLYVMAEKAEARLVRAYEVKYECNEDANRERARANAAEASLAEAKRLLKPFAKRASVATGPGFMTTVKDEWLGAARHFLAQEPNHGC